MKRIDEQPDNHERKPLDSDLEALLGQLGIEKAPARLTRRLKRIPREHRRRERPRVWRPPALAWAPALTALVLLVLAVQMLQPRQPSAAEIEQARRDVALAFHYVDRVGLRAGKEIERTLSSELKHPIENSVIRHLPFTEHRNQEERT